MWDENGIYPSNETGYAYTMDMKDEVVGKVNNGNFNRGSAVLKILYFNSRSLVVQHLPVKEREK